MRLGDTPNSRTGLGLVHVYTGDGKGKTTAALGLAMRAIGHGIKVYMIQFLKGGTYVGEYLASESFMPNFTIKQFGKKCTYSDMYKQDRDYSCGSCRDCFMTSSEMISSSKEALELSKEITSSGDYGLVILDEINIALSFKYIKIEDVLEMITNKSESTELVLTGRGAPEEIREVADYVTVLQREKHPFDRGIMGRWCVEY